MRKIDKILYGAFIPPFIIALIVLTFVVSIRELSNLSELLITRNASLFGIISIIGTILPRILMFSLPLSYLIGILIGLSGLSGESQITALRACGVPLRTLLRPILRFGAIVGMFTAVITLAILPYTNDTFSRIKKQISVAQATSQIQPRVFNEEMPKIMFYVDDLAADKQKWSHVFLADNRDPENPCTIIARSGTLVADSSQKNLQLHLEQGASYAFNPTDPSKDLVSEFKSSELSIDLKQRAEPSSNDRPQKVIEQNTLYLWRSFNKVSLDERIELLVEFHRRIALPFTIIPFALLGLTLAASTSKGGRTSGFALSLVVVISFYILFLNGIRLALVGKISPWLGAWGASILLSTIGLLLLFKIEQRHGIFHRISHFLWGSRNADFTQYLDTLPIKIRSFLKSHPSGNNNRYTTPKILDLYISRGFFIYFFWSLISCGTLFVLLTLFDLLDDIIRNRIPLISVIDYFIFLTPQILMLVVPMSALLAVLINFGILEKNSEVTAIKAGGWSLYRIAIPVILISSGLCLSLFLLQEYILPFANVRQDAIRNIIKGRPPQTSMRLQRKWISGESGRIYNYEYFDSNQDSFVDLIIYDIDMKASNLLRIIHCSRAKIAPNGTWLLEDGFVRNYKPVGFQRINHEAFKFPEKASYFETEIFQSKESSKRTYLELKNYINYLEKSGYNANELKVELNKKISFPLSCLVMALLGVPFSFSIGKKGAFLGIGMSIAIAISYWGISGVFEAMGAYGLLIPLLAAWAPNILFSATGLVLLFTIRT
jgi:LPS export ABC transporter permease LptF/LPS export ABC transporter permease LptG